MFDLSAIFSEKLATQKGTISAFHQDGTIDVTSHKDEKVISCFILKSGKDEPELAVDDDVIIIRDSAEEFGYILGKISRYMPVIEDKEEIVTIRKESTDFSRPQVAKVDGKRVTIEADQEIKLQCGKSSILLQRDGRIVLKGTNLTSRASGANKLKGGSVSIN